MAKIRPIAKNCNEVVLSRIVVLFSYQTAVAFRDVARNIIYMTTQFHSVTTTKHVNAWTEGNAPRVRVEQSLIDDHELYNSDPAKWEEKRRAASQAA